MTQDTPAALPDPSFERMFNAAILDLAAINEALDLDPDDGGAAPILEAIASLKAQAAASAAGGATPVDMVLFCPACGVQHIDEPDWQNDPQLGAIRYANAQQRIDTSGDREAQQSHHEPVQVLLRDGGMASGGHAEQPVQEVQLPATAIHEANKGMHVVSSGNGRFTVLQGQQNGQPSSEVQGLPQERNRRLEEDQSGRGESGGTSPKQSAARDEAIRLDARGVSGAPESSRADLQHLREGRASEAQEGPSIAGSLPCNGQDSGRAVLSLQHDAGLRERRLNVASQRDQVSCEAPLRAPIHRSHLCRPEDGGCGHIWRPADVPTNGVKAVKTVGKADSPILAALAAQSPAVPANCARCSGSGEDPEGFCDQSRGPDGATHDGPCRTCNGTGAAQSPDSGAGSEKARLLAESVLALDVVTEPGLRAKAAARTVLDETVESPAELALRSLACWLGVGGYNSLTIDAKVMERRIRDGIDAARAALAQQGAQNG